MSDTKLEKNPLDWSDLPELVALDIENGEEYIDLNDSEYLEDTSYEIKYD